MYDWFDRLASSRPSPRWEAGWVRLVLLALAGDVRPNPGPAAGHRRRRPPLPPSGRPPLLPATELRRSGLLRELRDFVGPERFAAMEESPDVAAAELASFGRYLYEADRSYNDYTEVANAFVGLRRQFKRQLTVAWDLADAWRHLEPVTSRLAFPAVALSAAIVQGLRWGWPVFVGLLALGSRCVLPAGEVPALACRPRRLPSDAGLVVWRSFGRQGAPAPRCWTGRGALTW